MEIGIYIWKIKKTNINELISIFFLLFILIKGADITSYQKMLSIKNVVNARKFDEWYKSERDNNVYLNG